MAPIEAKLVVLPYLQRWDGDLLHLRVLLTPRDALIEPFVGQSPPWPAAFFPAAPLKFSVKFLEGLENMPRMTDGVELKSVEFPPLPSAQTIFTGLKKQFAIDLAPPAPQELGRVRKHLPQSYQNSSGYAQSNSDLFSTDNTYSCYLKQQNPNYKYKPVVLPTKYTPSWGKLIASILRIPKFAEQAGLIRDCSIKIDPIKLKKGGFLFFAIDGTTSTQTGLSPTDYRTYSTRIPELSAAQDLFSPVFFPLVGPGSESGAAGHSEIFAEVDEYQDGWAKAVHCIQPQQLSPIKEEPDGTRPVKDLGIRIGWDDEQVTTWLDRQLSSNADFDCPLGVHGYRIDVRAADSGDWLPLTRGTGSFGKDLGAANTWLGTFDKELAVEIHPVQSMDGTTASFWLPMYFANWTGPSLVGPDETTLKLLGKTNNTTESQVRGIAPDIELRYGRPYQFRVRLMDHTGGGPVLGSKTGILGPNPVSRTVRFRRWIRPLPPVVVDDIPVIGQWPDSESAPLKLDVKRSQLSWPAVAYTGAYTDIQTQLQEVQDANRVKFPNENERPETTLPDPDANELEIAVWVNTLPQDPLATNGTYALLYTTTRSMPLDFFASLTLSFDWKYCRSIWIPEDDGFKWNAERKEGPIVLPTARLLQLRIRIVASTKQPVEPNTYFGANDVMYSPAVTIPMRKNASTEAKLYIDNTESDTISAYFLQPPPPPTEGSGTAVVIGNATARLATELNLRAVGTVLRATPGNRVVFGCSGALRHVLGPDRTSISFPSDTDLIRQWIVVIRLTIERDWTWDSMKAGGIVVKRTDLNNKEIIRFSPPYSAGQDAISGSLTDRNRTQLIILDALDPKPASGTNPKMLFPSYTIDTSYLVAPPPPTVKCNVRIPVAFPPVQTPRVVSVGFAMSPYSPDPVGYTFTSDRRRIVWVEFAEKLQDEEDRYFARVLQSAPDPMLVNSEFTPQEVIEPDLPIDPELARRVVPDQANDNSGLTAMQPMIPSNSPFHWGLPLPQGLTEDSPELFGYFTYEFRVGHYNDVKINRWCTAQGRFGAAQRVAGMQHPYPILTCSAFRSWKTLRISASHALPVPSASTLRPNLPATTLCFFLYAQAAQIDGSGQRRNVLVDFKYGRASNNIRTDPRRIKELVAFVEFENQDIDRRLQYLGFVGRTPISALAVELENQLGDLPDPMGANLGRQRILRTSTLIAIPPSC